LSLPSEAESPHLESPGASSLSTEIVDDLLRLEGGAVGTGFGLFVGLPLVSGGFVLLAGSWRYVSLYLDGPSDELAKYLLGWALLAIGGLAALGGETWYLDSRSRTFVRTWRALRWTLRTRVVEFERIVAVRCVRLVVGGDAHEAFAVEIDIGNDKNCRLATRAHLQEALAMSARLCQLLDLPLGEARKTSG